MPGHSNQRDIIARVVQNHGSIRSFNQIKGTCIGHSAKWLRCRILGKDFFTIERLGPAVPGMAVIPKGFAQEGLGYSTIFGGEDALSDLIQWDIHTSSAKQEAKAAWLKLHRVNPVMGWIPLGDYLDDYLKYGSKGQEGGKAAAVKGKGEDQLPKVNDAALKLVEKALSRKAYYVVSLPGADGGVDHAIAIDSTKAALAVFDPLVGELMFRSDEHAKRWAASEKQWLKNVNWAKGPIKWYCWT